MRVIAALLAAATLIAATPATLQTSKPCTVTVTVQLTLPPPLTLEQQPPDIQSRGGGVKRNYRMPLEQRFLVA